MSVVREDLLQFERPLLDAGEIVVGIDEVGRGALAGPLLVGAVVLTRLRTPPLGLNDSKKLSPQKRESLGAPLRAWCDEWSLGAVSANEIDAWGLRLALSVAVNRAIENLRVAPTHVLIDGPLNLLDAPAGSAAGVANAPTLRFCDLRHTTIIKGDARSATIAAASVLAKVARDALMVSMHDENVHYGWSSNKGYGTAVHLAAIERHGLHSQHRRSWRLPPLQFPHAV